LFGFSNLRNYLFAFTKKSRLSFLFVKEKAPRWRGAAFSAFFACFLA